MLLTEYYDDSSAPHEALGRAARRLAQGGALYLGGGIGIERIEPAKGTAKFALTTGSGSKAESFAGPLSAVIRGMALAGAKTTPDSPGGAAKVTDPAAAARLRELSDRERDAQAQIDRMTRRLARTAAREVMPTAPGVESEDRWERRRIDELNVELSQIRAERAKLLSTGKVEEAEAGKPGTNWKQVTPAAKKKLSGILKHYRGMAHPFTQCVADNTKRFGKDGAERVCAVVKDLNKKSTRWRAGGSKAQEGEAGELIEAALGRIEVVEQQLGTGMSVVLVEGVEGAPASMVALGEALTADFGLLALAGHPIAEMVFERFDTGTGGTPRADGRPKVGARPGQPGFRRAPRPDLDAAKKMRGKGGEKKPAAPGSGAHDESKHPRGEKGTSEGGRFVKKGSSGEDVRAAQRAVGAKPDGKFGPKTEAEVRAFQRKHGLKVDGVIGHQTAVQIAGGDGKNAKVGALKASDHAKLKAMRRGAKGRSGTRGRAPERRRGGETIGR